MTNSQAKQLQQGTRYNMVLKTGETKNGVEFRGLGEHEDGDTYAVFETQSGNGYECYITEIAEITEA